MNTNRAVIPMTRAGCPLRHYAKETGGTTLVPNSSLISPAMALDVLETCERSCYGDNVTSSQKFPVTGPLCSNAVKQAFAPTTAANWESRPVDLQRGQRA
jgi:hypothetical protein